MRTNGVACCWPMQTFAVRGEASEMPFGDGITNTAAVA